MPLLPSRAPHLVADGAGRRFFPVLGPFVSIRLEILFFHVLRSYMKAPVRFFKDRWLSKTLNSAPESLTHAVPPVVLLHDIFPVEHLVADFAGIQLLAVLLLMLGKVAVGGEKARADVTLEGLVV